MDNPAVPEDLRDRDFEVDGQQAEKVAQTRLDEAWRALRAEVPSLLTRVAAGEVETEIVVDVLCSAALRVLKNPDNLDRFSGGIDDWREDSHIAESAQTNDLFFTSAELRRINPPTYGGFTAGSIAYS